MPRARDSPSPQFEGGGAGRIDVHDGEIAVAIDAGHGPARATAVSERDGDFVAAQVVCVGQDLAVGDDDAGAAAAAADPDDAGADAIGDSGNGGLEVFEDAHGCSVLLGRGGGSSRGRRGLARLTCDLQSTTNIEP